MAIKIDRLIIEYSFFIVYLNFLACQGWQALGTFYLMEYGGQRLRANEVFRGSQSAKRAQN
jgi:hypothetical protein